MEPLTVNEQAFVLAALRSCEQRLDGRRPFDYRSLRVQLGDTPGNCELALGDSLVLAHVSATQDPPYPDRPHEGFVKFNVDFLPMAHPNFEEVLGYDSLKAKRVGNPVSREIERVLEKVVKKAKALNPESLCIQAGKLAWKVSVDLHILNHKGNLVDACMLAAVLALMHFRIPVTKIMPNREVQTLTMTKSLSVHFLPICVTFGFLDAGNMVLLDPTLKEESLLDGKIIVCMNIYGDILTLQKTGGACVGTDILLKCLEVAKIKAKDLTEAVREALHRDKAQRGSRSSKEEAANATAAERLISGI